MNGTVHQAASSCVDRRFGTGLRGMIAISSMCDSRASVRVDARGTLPEPLDPVWIGHIARRFKLEEFSFMQISENFGTLRIGTVRDHDCPSISRGIRIIQMIHCGTDIEPYSKSVQQ
jgi:hypothetical protein